MKFSIIQLLIFYQINEYVTSDDQSQSKIERFDHGYKYSIRTKDIVRTEEAHFNPDKPDETEVSIYGDYYFNSTDGRTYHVSYTYNKNGYSAKFGTGPIKSGSKTTRIGAPAIKSLVGGGLG